MAQAQVIDPRPKTAEVGGDSVVVGYRCDDCRYPIIQKVPRCPECSGSMAADNFGPDGIVAASTCLRVRVPGYEPPYAIAYVDLLDGPRVLVHTPDAQVIPPGAKVSLTGLTERGDLAAAPLEGLTR